MAVAWQFSFKPTFLHELHALEAKAAHQVLKKLDILAQDPTPDAKTKKQLKHLDGKLHRLRAGDFRIFYTFQSPFVSLLSVQRRDDQTYDDVVDSDFLGGPEGSAEPSGSNPAVPDSSAAATWDRWLSPPSSKATQLPRAIDQALLDALKVPKPFHEALLRVGTEDQLLDCPVPQDVLHKVIDAVTGRPIEQIAAQPDLLLAEPEDLLRYRQGELFGFLLRLEPEQEKLVRWALGAKGATLVKGGPGSGKSTVALYRAREVLGALEKAKVDSPRILFTTYTRALTRVSEQLLRSLVGAEGMRHIDVKTADAVLRQLALDGGAPATLVKDSRVALARAIDETRFDGSSLKIASQKAALEKLSKDFLLEEILGVIEGRGLASLPAYLEASRPGRRRALSKVQREAIWRLRDAFLARLGNEGVTTPEGWRKRAAERVRAGEVQAAYDAVLIDEAQDLSPTAIAALVGLCKSPNGVFLTADANQSIYGSAFRWIDVHEWLRFQGRTAVLRANHRSTREIGEAAIAYLRGGADAEIDADDAPAPTRYVHAGPIPAVRAVAAADDEAKLLARFFRQATRALKLGLGGCAVLTPTNDAASRLAGELTEREVKARKVDASDLDLADPGVKVMTLKNAKGLEFPIVALAGFSDGRYPYVPDQASDEDRDEIVARERRTLFVAMTRAMRALLVVVRDEADSPLLRGLSPPAWSDGRER